jgi:hypothetical protein
MSESGSVRGARVEQEAISLSQIKFMGFRSKLRAEIDLDQNLRKFISDLSVHKARSRACKYIVRKYR